MLPAQPQPLQQQAAQPQQPPPGWVAGMMQQQQQQQQPGLPTSMPGMGFGSIPMANGSGMVPAGLNGMLAARWAPGMAGGSAGPPGAEGLVYSLPLQDARFHFSDGRLAAGFGGQAGFGGGPPSNADMLAAFMPGCEEGGGGSSGSAGLFGGSVGGIFGSLSGLAPSTGGAADGSAGHRPHQPLRPSPLSHNSSGGSGPNAHGSGGGGTLGSAGGSVAQRPQPPQENSASSAMPIAALMFPAGSLQSEGSLPLGPMLRAPTLQQASLAGFQAASGAAPPSEQGEHTSQRQPQLTPQQAQAQHDMQRFLNAEPGQPQLPATAGSVASGPSGPAQAAGASQKPHSAFSGYAPTRAPQPPGQPQPQQQAGGPQPPWPATPQQQWAAAQQWAAGQQQQMMAGSQGPNGAVWAQHAALPPQPPGHPQPLDSRMMAAAGQLPGFGHQQQLQQPAAGQPQGSGQPVSGQQPAASGQMQQAVAPQHIQHLPPEQQQQQQMATMLQWQQMQMQQMQAAFAMQQQALASGQQLPFPGAGGMPFGNPYMAQYPMTGGMWPPQVNGHQLMMLQQQAQQQALLMQQQQIQAAQQASQQQQQQQAAQQASQQEQPQQQPQPQTQQLSQVPCLQGMVQPSLASAHSSGTDFLQQPLQPLQPLRQRAQQPAQPPQPPVPLQNGATRSGSVPMSGVVQGAVSSGRPGSQGAGLTASDAGAMHVSWECGSGSAPVHGPGSDPGSAGRSDGVAVVPDLGAAGSISGSGLLSVPSLPASALPASALLAGALMPPPHPVGAVPMTRAERVDRYREKKARRTDGGAVRYVARQQNAHRRPRIKGRFVKAGELAEYLAANPGVTVTHAGRLLGHGEDGDTESNAQTDAGDSTAVAMSAPALPAAPAHVVPSASNASSGVNHSAPPAATA